MEEKLVVNSEKATASCELGNLVVLLYGNNHFSFRVLSPDDPDLLVEGLVIDAEKGVWRLSHSSLWFMVGEARSICRQMKAGRVIGVFDRSNNDHLCNMVSAAKSASAKDRSPFSGY